MSTALSYLVWPFVMAAGTYGTYVGLEAGYPLPVVFFASGAALLACVLIAEQLIPGRADVILGSPARIIFWYTAFIGILGVIGHSNTRLRLPSALHRLLMTPQVHALHHSIDRTLSDSNYANVFPIWDVVFGTFSDPDRHAVGEIGVRDDPIPEGFFAQLLSPFICPRLAKESVSRGA